MPATALRCRICESEFPLDPVGVCSRCFGPLEPIYAADRTLDAWKGECHSLAQQYPYESEDESLRPQPLGCGKTIIIR